MPIQHPVVKVAAVQVEPCWFNVDAGVEKTIKLIAEAATQGAKLVVFPELWLPGYPHFLYPNDFASIRPLWRKYLLNAITLHGSELLTIRKACLEQKIYINLSFAERLPQGSSMWMANVTIDDQGTIIGHRRKIKPTGIERMLFGDATGDTVNNVVQTPFGRVGNLQCWEHMQPLLKYHTYFQNEQIHCASWPCKFPYAGFEPWSFTKEASIATTQTYAMEGGTFAVMATNVMSEEGARLQGIDLERSYFSVPGGGCSAVFAPDGKMLTDLLEPGAEGIIYAVCNLAEIYSAKALADCVGHYMRPDILRLVVDKEPKEPVVYRPITNLGLSVETRSSSEQKMFSSYTTTFDASDDESQVRGPLQQA